MYHIIITTPIGDPDLLILVYNLPRWENVVFAVACGATVDELW